MVKMSTPVSAMSVSVCTISSQVSPKPSIIPDFVRISAIELLGGAQHPVAAFVAGLGAHAALQAGHSFHVVVEDCRLGRYHLFQRVVLAGQVGNQHLNGAIRVEFPHLADSLGKDLRAAIFQVVAGHGRNHGVAQPHLLHRPGHADGFNLVQTRGTTALNRAEAARAGAGIAQDHERRRARIPALADVRAPRLLADSMQVHPAHDLLKFAVLVALFPADADPVRLSFDCCCHRK